MGKLLSIANPTLTDEEIIRQIQIWNNKAELDARLREKKFRAQVVFAIATALVVIGFGFLVWKGF